MTEEAAKRKINRPHWRDIAEEQSLKIIALEQEIARLRSIGVDGHDLAALKATAFAAGVAAATQQFTK